MTNISKGKRSSAKLKSMGSNGREFLNRITKSLYYSRLPMTDRLSLPVTELAAELFTEVKCGLTLERLDVEEAGRISRNACVSPCSLVLALLYLERLKDCNPEYLYRVAPSELFLVSLMVASKFLNDEGEVDEVFNTEWANSGDLSIGQINRLEKEFLRAIDWAIFVRIDDFWDRLKKLEKDIAYKEAEKRGWFSYTELTCLMETLPLTALIHAFVSVSSICLATYAAGVVTLLGSVLVASQLPGTWLAPGETWRSTDSRQAASTEAPANFTGPRSITSDNDTLDQAQTILEEAEIEFSSRQFHFSSGSCNSTVIPDRKKNATEQEYIGWEWWLDSIITWLPEYSKHEDNNRIIGSLGNDNLQQRIGAFITNTQLFVSDQRYTRETKTENLIIKEINWKETLASNFEIPSHDWRYYVSKISLDHRH